MKNSTLATKLMLAAVFLAVLVYFGVNVAAYFSDPYTTTVAFSYTGENAVTVSGYVVREEEALTGGGELVYSSRAEGERVSRGGEVALVYPTAQALADANALRELTDQLDQLRYARSLSAGSQASARLDEEIAKSLVDFRGELAAGGDGGDGGQHLRTAVLRRGYAISGSEGLDASIAALQERVAALSGPAEADVTRITAPRAGLFSGLVDGYEGVLRLEGLEEMTPSDYRAIAPSVDPTAVGKMIYGDEWAFVTLMQSEQVKRLQPGDIVTLRFQKGLDRDMTMKVASISGEEGGRRVVVFSSERYLQLATLLRHQNAQVIFTSYEGVRVPRSAVRVDAQPITDEEGLPVKDSQGNPKTTPVTCVYCLWGDTAMQKPVTVLWQEEDYILVAPDEEALGAYAQEKTRESRRLRAGEQVITAAAELYDGKVVQ